MSGTSFTPSKNAPTWNTIAARLKKFNPAIDLKDYFDSPKDVYVKDYTTQGVDFVVSSDGREQLLKTLRGAKTGSGKKAFEEGRWKGAAQAAKDAGADIAGSFTGKTSDGSYALDVSFAATKGIGFREIWYLELSDHEMRMRDARGIQDRDAQARELVIPPEFDPKFGANSIDLSSLHWAVEDENEKTGRSQCQVHIDNMGIYANLGRGGTVTPDFLYHTFVELVFRTKLNGILPDWLVQRVDFIIPNSHENLTTVKKFGIQANLIDRDDLRLSVRGLCRFDNGPACSVTLNLGGRW
jgi:hypothetical protein